MRSFLPDMPKVPPGATLEQRRAMLEEYKRRLREANPRSFNSEGEVVGWFTRLLQLFTRKERSQ